MPDKYEQKFMDILDAYKEGIITVDEAVRRIFGVMVEIQGG